MFSNCCFHINFTQLCSLLTILQYRKQQTSQLILCMSYWCILLGQIQWKQDTAALWHVISLLYWGIQSDWYIQGHSWNTALAKGEKNTIHLNHIDTATESRNGHEERNGKAKEACCKMKVFIGSSALCRHWIRYFIINQSILVQHQTHRAAYLLLLARNAFIWK